MTVVARMVISLAGKKAAARFDKATSSVAESQARKLREILRRNAETEYGREFHFGSIQTLAEYGKALRLYEGGVFVGAARALGNWRGTCPADEPSLVLMYRAVEAQVKGKPANHPVWELTEK